MNLYTKQVYKGAAHKKFCPFVDPAKVKVISEKDYQLEAPASTISIDRDGEIVLPSAFDLPRFLKNPLFLWNHRWWGDIEDSLGSVTGARATDDALIAVFQYDADVCERARKCWDKVSRKRSIRGFSVGFRMHEWVTRSSSDERKDMLPEFARNALENGDVWLVHTKVELLEISQVLVPANEDSVVPQDVDETVVLGLSASTNNKTERTDEMELTKLLAEMDEIKKSLSTFEANQQNIASALSKVAEATQATAKSLESVKETQAKAAKPAAPEVASEQPQIKSVDEVPDHIREQIISETMEQMEGIYNG